MYNTACSIVSGVTYPARVVWHWNSSPKKIAVMQQQFTESCETAESYDKKALNIRAALCDLSGKIRDCKNSFPRDHQVSILNEGHLMQPLRKLYTEVCSAQDELERLVDRDGPEALRSLKGRWFIIGEHYEPLQRTLDRIKLLTREIDQVENEVERSGISLIMELEKASVRSAETFSVVRELQSLVSYALSFLSIDAH